MRKSEPDYLVLTAVVSAASMIAFQVAGKATRDALFLSNFSLESLPAVVAASAGVAIVAVFGASRLLSTKGPGAVIPYAFGASALLLLAEWLFYSFSPRTTAVVFYFHMAGFGAILISGFWSIISELFDPRTAKAQIGRIAGAGTLGGLIGGVIAERIGTVFSIYAMLPVLAVLHLLCALLNLRLRAPMGAITARPPATGEPEAIVKSGIAVLRSESYLKLLALLVMLGTIGETLLDYVLKDRAVATFSQGQQLIRFFAVFYTGTSLVTFLVQAGLSRYFLKQFGVARTISTMPLLVAGGGLGSLVWPGLLSVSLLRGFQSVLRSSLFRSGYEVLFAPVSPDEKRAAKTIVDVSFDKLGDAIGAGIIRLVLLVGLSALTNSRLLTFIAVLLGALSLLLTLRLGRGYVSTLEKSLLNQAANLEMIDFEERTTRATMLRTLGTVELGAVRNLNLSVEKRQPVKEFAEMDAVTKQFSDLQSESSDVVRAALARPEPLDPLLVAAAIRLLARDDVSEDAVNALRRCVEATVGQMTDALLNAEEDFAVRRRIPRVLAYSVSERAAEGLVRGLYDSRFEVRFSCGRGLSKICAMDPRLPMPVESIYTAIRKEMETARRLSEMPRVIDCYEDQGESIPGKASWKSTDVRLEHIFRLLSLNLPREPLQISFQALHTNDTYLRGTALEYLESVLPAGIRESLLEFLEGSFQPSASPRTVDHLTNELMRSRHQIELKVSQAPGVPLRKV